MKWTIKKTVTKNFIYNGINTAVTIVVGIALSVIIARFLGPANYGVYSLLIWVLGVLSLISLMGFPFTIQKYVSEYDGRKEQDTIRKIIAFVLKIEVFWGVIVAILLIILADRLSLWLRHPEFKNFFWIIALLLVPSAVSTILTSVTKGLQIFKNIMVVTVIRLILSLVFILLVLNRGAGIIGILWVQLGTNLISVFLFWILLKGLLSPCGGLNLARPIKKKVFNFNLTFLAIMVTELIVRQKSGVFFLNLFRTTEEAGYYGLAFGIAIMAVRFVPESFVHVIGPALSNRYGAQDRAGLSQIFIKSTKYLTLMIVPICTGIIILARPLVELVYGKSYLPAAGILPILIIASALGVMASVAAWVIYAIERQNINLVIGIVAAVLNLTMAVLLIPKHGIYGAAIANSVAQVAGFFLAFSWVHIKMKFRFPLVSFFKTCLAGIIAGGIMYIFMNVWGENLLNLITLLIVGEGSYLLIVYLIQKEDIKELKNYLLDVWRKRGKRENRVMGV